MIRDPLLLPEERAPELVVSPSSISESWRAVSCFARGKTSSFSSLTSPSSLLLSFSAILLTAMVVAGGCCKPGGYILGCAAGGLEDPVGGRGGGNPIAG